MITRALLFIPFLVLPGLVNSAETQVLKDYHMSLYKDVQGSVDSFELFTKVEGKQQFFGLSCNRQSPLPLMQVLLFDQEIMSEQTRLVDVMVKIDSQPINETLNGILTVVDNADEFSNKIRFEVPPKYKSSFTTMQNSYRSLINQLQTGDMLSVKIKHRVLGEKEITFSLRGLNSLMAGHQAICF